MALLCHHLCAMRYLMYQSAMPDTASHASTRRQARTDGGGGGEKESSVPELFSLESVCGKACVYRHIARCVFTTLSRVHNPRVCNCDLFSMGQMRGALPSLHHSAAVRALRRINHRTFPQFEMNFCTELEFTRQNSEIV